MLIQRKRFERESKPLALPASEGHRRLDELYPTSPVFVCTLPATIGFVNRVAQEVRTKKESSIESRY